MAQKLLIATRNAGKFPEIVSILAGIPFEPVSLNDVPDLPKNYEVEEPAMTFEGNAIIKAFMLGKKTGLLTIAEDAGLEVDALGGRPGVLSARYAPGSDADRNAKLLSELAGVPDTERTARFKAVVAIYDPKTDKIRTCEGVYKGTIALEPRGDNGFGYDPVFYSLELQKTGAEMTRDEKNSVSHRGKAFRQAKELLKEFV